MKPRRSVSLLRIRTNIAAVFLGLAAWMSLAAQAQTPPAPANLARATFAGGCFWCVEKGFDRVPGVVSTASGYTGGRLPRPTYEQVVSKTTGHAEAVEVVFDPARVSYAQLLEYYWRTIDPTTKDRQFCHAGSPCRTAIFVHDQAQLAAAQASKAALEKSKPFEGAIVTEIVLAGPFYAAEDFHQHYYKKSPIRYKALSAGLRSRCTPEGVVGRQGGAVAGSLTLARPPRDLPWACQP